MHARVGAAIRRLHPDDVPALARHYFLAASAGTARAAVDYAVQAAGQADRRYAYDVAVSLLEQALDASARAPGSAAERAERQVDLLGRLLRAQIRAGRIAAARATRQQAVDAATAAGRDDLVTAAFAAWTEPTPWQTRPYGVVDKQPVAQTLGELSAFLGRPEAAARHFALAEQVARALELTPLDRPGPGRAGGRHREPVTRR